MSKRTDSNDEGMNFGGFLGAFGSSHEKTEARFKSERRAGMTPKQRARKKTAKTTTINFRTTDHVRGLAEALAEEMGVKSLAPVVEQAIIEFAKAKGIEE